MARQQGPTIAPPVPTDERLIDFSAIIQRAFDEVFELAHVHSIKTGFPGATEGKITDIVTVDNGTTVYLLVKTSRGWFRTAALTAV